MNPKVGDIWEWSQERYDSDELGYIQVAAIILILTEPVYNKDVYFDDRRWEFTALELDGDDPGVIDSWMMRTNDYDKWRQLA